MKKALFIMAAVLCVAVTAVEAQPRAIGGRLGYGVDFSYQHSLSANMLSLDVNLAGFGHGVGAVATYDWVFPINSWQEKGTWNWYAGVGGGAGFWWWGDSHAYVGVAGRIGVEYNFWFPLQLSIDWAPVIGPSFGNGWVGFGAGHMTSGGIGIRYRF